MAQTIEYCYPGLATGANDGSSKTDAYQSFAAAESGASASARIRVRSGTYILTAAVAVSTSGSLVDKRTWVCYDWDNDLEITPETWLLNGGSLAVTLDANSVAANCLSITSLNDSEFIGFRFINATGDGVKATTAGFRCRWRMFSVENVGGDGFGFYVQNYNGAFDIGALISCGGRGLYLFECSVNNVLFKNISGAYGLEGRDVSARNCVFDNAGTVAAISAATNVQVQACVDNCQFYDCPLGIYMIVAWHTSVSGLIFQGCTYAFRLPAAASLYYTRCAFRTYTGILDPATPATSALHGGEESVFPGSDPMPNASTGDYTLDSGLASIKNLVTPIGYDTTMYYHLGIGQEYVTTPTPTPGGGGSSAGRVFTKVGRL